MKKFFILLIPFLLCGCGNKELKIDGDITEIKYNDIYIMDSEFENIREMINLSFDKKSDGDLQNKLTIKTDKEIYYFSVSENYLSYDGYEAYNDELGDYLQNLAKKYQNEDFYTIDYMKNYDATSDDNTIVLDKTSNYIIINLGQKVTNLKINEIEEKDGKYTDIDLLYSQENVNSDKIVIRKSINYETPDIRISFENGYNYVVSIIPIYNLDKEVIEYKTEFKAK